jgi:hypothetical protein
MGAPSDNSAEIAREADAARQARIDQGTAHINEQFAAFDDPYFQGVQQSALDFFNPDLDKQAENTRETLIKNLARSGNLDSSFGAETFGDLDEETARQRAAVADKARAAMTDARGRVENERGQLINQLSATADPAAAAAASAAAAQSLSAPPQFEPLGDLFGRFVHLGAQNVAGAREGYKNTANQYFGIKPPPAFGTDSSREVS